MKPLGKYSVREAVEIVFPRLPKKFSMIKLHFLVAKKINRPFVFMDTVRRKLFELRQEGLIDFENIDKARSLYQKKESHV